MQAPPIAQTFAADGYAIIPAFKSAEEIAELRARALEIVERFDERESASIFSTTEQAAKSDAYFLSSGDQVRCFFEERAFDESGALRVPKERAINKIGHAMHDLDPVFDRFSRDPRLAEIAAQLGFVEPLLYQSMYIFKQPEIGGEVAWHQDAAFFSTQPVSVVAFWFALEDADRTNGCLWVQPGGHRSPQRNRFFVRDGKAQFETLDTTPWPTLASAMPLEVATGTLVVFHGLLPHYSCANTSPKSRHAYTLHVVEGTARYAEDNWLQRGATLPARGFR